MSVEQNEQDVNMEISSKTGRLCFDRSVGNIQQLTFYWQDKTLQPLHKAHWVNSGETLPASMPLVEQKLSGDFFCSPFGPNNLDDGPIHGLPANSSWQHDPASQELNAQSLSTTLTMTLKAKPYGATYRKQLTLSANAPMLYQMHEISGGKGKVSAAHHVMIGDMQAGRIFFSKKKLAMTPEQPLETDKNWLQYPAISTDLPNFTGSNGQQVNLTQYPVERQGGTVDFVTLVDERENSGELEVDNLAWTAVIRPKKKDIIFVLKKPAELPVTMFWYSNGGRAYPPWSGQHVGVLGIEDGIASGVGGHKEAVGENAINALGVDTCLVLNQANTHRVHHVIGAIPNDLEWTDIADIRLSGNQLLLSNANGAEIKLPFDRVLFGG